MKHSIPVLPFLRRSAVARLVPALALCALALPARADSPSLFGLTVNGDDIACASGEGWTFDGATVSLAGPGPFVLSTGSVSFTSNVVVVAQSDCAVTFSNLEVFAGNHAGLSPFTVSPGVSVALRLDGNTVLKAGAGAAAITVVSNATGVASLTIDADASDTFHTLGANGGGQGAGIGGGDGEACGSVTILGGLLTVEGGANAAGIGGGRNGAGGAVTISGGRLNVKSAGSYAFVGGKLKTTNGGAAIGGGYQAAGGSTAISGGTVSLTGVGDGAAIGPGKDGAGGTTAITGGSIFALVGAVEPSPSNGVARVWPVSVTGLTDGETPSLPWLPATYGTNDLVATMGGEVCVWLPTGDYAYGEPESDGAGGWRRHAVLVDAEGNVTLEGWVVSSDPTSASAGLLYSNNFTTRTSSDATPSGRWMEAAYVSGALVRSVSSISPEGREPYNEPAAYHDGWTMKTGYCRSTVKFTVADDGDNPGALVNATETANSAIIAMQPFYNEFTTGVLKVSVDIRTPSLTDSFNSSAIACATLAPFYKSALDVTDSTFAAPMHFGPANLKDDGNAWRLRAVTRGRAAADSPGGSYFGQSDSRNDIASGSWVRYEAVLDLDAGTYTATFANLGTAHPTPDTTGGSPVAFRQDGSAASSTTFAFLDPLTEGKGGIAGLAFYVAGIKQASSAVDAPMFDNIAVSWKRPGAEEFVSVYENDFSTRRYRQIEPAGATVGTYITAPTTNVVQSSFYERATINNDYGVSDSSTSARRLVPDGAPYLGQDGWRRIAGEAYFTMIDPNNGGYGWNNASVLRATGRGKTGMVAVPIGTTVSSGKVRLYCDILMGALTNSTSQTRDIGAAAFLAGDGAYTNACYDSTTIRIADIATALRNKGVCGAGTCYSGRAAGKYETDTRLYNFDGASYTMQESASGESIRANCGKWLRFVVTLDLDAGKYDYDVYDLGYVGQKMDYDYSNCPMLVEAYSLNLASSAIRNVDSVVLFSDGQDNYNGNPTTFNGKKLGRFPLFDNVRVCLVDDDGADGTELYACNFEYGYRMSVQNAAALVGPSDREGAGRWIRRGGNYGTISAVDAGDGDNVVVMDGLGWISGNTIATGYAVQPFGATTKDFDSVDFAADIRPPACFARSSDCFTYVEIGGDAYAQGVHRPASSSWRNEPRIGFGFSVGAGYNDVKQYTNVVLAVQSVASTGQDAATSTSPYVIDKSHWYRFRVKAKPASNKFTVKVFDQGTAKPLASDADGALVATFADMDLPSFGDEGMTTFGLAGAGFASSFGGGIDDPYVALIDNLSASASNANEGFAAFLVEYGLPPDTDPLFVTNDIPVGARYVYGIEPMDVTTNAEGHPLVAFSLGADGAPVFELAPEKRPDELGLIFSMLWSRSLSPWETVGECFFGADGDESLCRPPVNTSTEPCMFFKYRLAVEGE